MAVLVSDSFNRTNSATTLGNTDSYAGGTVKTWTKVGSAGVYGINNNQAYMATPNASRAIAVVDSGSPDGKFTITFATIGASERPKLVFRAIDQDNFWAVGIGSGFYELFYYSAGSSGSNFWQGLTPTNGDVVTVVTNGTSISVYINSVLQTTITNTTHQAATKHGINLYNYPNSRLDNFKVEDLVTGSVIDAGTIAITSAGNIIANGSIKGAGQSAISSSGTSMAIGGALRNSQTAISVLSNLTANGIDVIGGQSVISANSNLTALSNRIIGYGGSLSSISSLIADGEVISLNISVNLSANSNLSAQASRIINQTATFLAGGSIMTGTADKLSLEISVDLSSNGSLNGSGSKVSNTASSLSSVGSFQAVATLIKGGSAVLLSESDLSAILGPEYREIIRMAINIAQSQTVTIDVNQRNNYELNVTQRKQIDIKI